MSKSKEIILFVPGMGAGEPGQYLEKLMTGIGDYCADRGYKLETASDPGPDHEGRRNLSISDFNDESKDYEIREVFWGDLRPKLSSEPATHKLLLGLDLFLYWVLSGNTWWAARRSKYMMFGMLFSLFVFILWYYGALAAVLTAVGANPEMFGAEFFPDTWAPAMKDMGESMGSWKVWGMAMALMAIIPATEIIDITYATKRYLQNRNHMRQKVIARVKREVMAAQREAGADTRITLLAHSYGVVVATDALNDLAPEYSRGLRFMTLGGPLALIQAHSKSVAQARETVEKWLSDGHLTAWIDFYSRADWMCTASPVARETQGFSSQELTSTTPWHLRASGASHSMYFSDYEVLEELLEK